VTIRWYPTAAELTGSDADKRKCGRYELTVGHRVSAQARPVFRKIKFTVCGTTDGNCDTHAVSMAEDILAMTDSKVVKFVKIMGHYRQDEILPVVPVNERNFAIVGYSPDPATFEALNLSLFIPNFNGTSADALALLDPGANAAIGNVRWTDQSETELEANYATTSRGVTITAMSRLYNEPFAEDNAANGIADGTLGPTE